MVLLLDHYFCAGVGDYFHVGGGWNSKTRQMCSVPVKTKKQKNKKKTQQLWVSLLILSLYQGHFSHNVQYTHIAIV